MAPRVDGVRVIVVVLAVWLVAGAMIALLVSGGIRVAEARGDQLVATDPMSSAPEESLTVGVRLR